MGGGKEGLISQQLGWDLVKLVSVTRQFRLNEKAPVIITGQRGTDPAVSHISFLSSILLQTGVKENPQRFAVAQQSGMSEPSLLKG